MPRFMIIAALLVVAFVGSLVGCDRPAALPRAAQGSPPTSLTPRETIERLRVAHAGRSYREVEALIVEARAVEAVRLLSAIDEFLDANRLLCDYVRESVAAGVAGIIDQSSIAANLDVFSRYTEVKDEEIHGDIAEVSFSVDGQLPLRRAALRRDGGVWKYDPGEGYAPNLPEAFRKMAEGLRTVLSELKQGRLKPDQIREKPDTLVEEVRIRLVPGVSLLKPPSKPPD